jgi:hypothetical protein
LAESVLASWPITTVVITAINRILDEQRMNYCLIFLPLCISIMADTLKNIVIIKAMVKLVMGGESATPSMVKRIPLIM